MRPSHERFERLTRRWLDLSERRLAYYEALYRSGRWRRYFQSEEHFASRMLDVIKVAKLFRKIVGARSRDDGLRPAA